MTHALLISLFALGIAATFAAVSQTTGSRPTDEEEIREHIERIFAAYRTRDRAAVRRTHAEDWRGFIRASTHVIRGIDEYMKQAEAVLNAPVELLGHRMVDFDLVFRGPIAIVSYVAEIEWRLDGTVTGDKLRVQDVYAKEDGKWNQVASNVATHPDSIAAFRQTARLLSSAERAELLREREAVWRAWFANDRAALDLAIPDESLAINAGQESWQDKRAILESSAQFAAARGKLVRLEFPRTDVQVYGDVAILYTTYVTETEAAGRRNVLSGRGTEIFVRRDGRWRNTGWHLDSGR